MFVRQSKYDELEQQYIALANKWNKLVAKINRLGGQNFLDRAAQKQSLDQDDIKRLIVLCHPDKHDGKPVAAEMTRKLLAMRT